MHKIIQKNHLFQLKSTLVMDEISSQIIDIAIKMICEGGYQTLSFRQIASELEIRSASIHYHFSAKEDLGAAVVERYSEFF